MAGRIRLEILGLTYSQMQVGAYALVLGEAEGERRIPIVIGQSEAQSIAIRLQGLETPRPLTHDLIYTLLNTFGIGLREVYIYKREKDVFYSELHCCRNINDIKKIDARTSDAIAMAVRANCPIYIEESIFNEASVSFNPAHIIQTSNIASQQGDIKTASLDELQRQLQQAVNIEDYEMATKIRDEINRRE